RFAIKPELSRRWVAKSPQRVPIAYRDTVGREAENEMAVQHMRQAGCRLAFAALFACLALPTSAQMVPLPSARPSATQAQPNAATTPSPVAKPAVPSRGQGATAPQNPVSNPFTALLVKPSPQCMLTPEQRAIIERVKGYLSGLQRLIVTLIHVGPSGRQT